MELATWLVTGHIGGDVAPRTDQFGEPPMLANWATMPADEAQVAWRDLDAWVSWLKASFGLPPGVVPPLWHRHDELVWELSALHAHWLSCYDETAPPSAAIAWLRDFTDSRARLRDWVAVCGTRVDRDRPTRRAQWPGEAEVNTGGEVEILDRESDFDEFVREDLRRRRLLEAVLPESGDG